MVNAKCVFVFPNNGNVIFAANQAAELAEKEVHVIPRRTWRWALPRRSRSKTMCSGEENAKRMAEAAEHVKTGTVTYSGARQRVQRRADSQGYDIIGMHNGKIEYCGNSVHDVVLDMMKAVVTE